MMKKIMQDILTNTPPDNGGEHMRKNVQADVAKPVWTNKAKPAKVVLSQETVLKEKDQKNEGVPTFSSIETSPIFEKMKQHNKDRQDRQDQDDFSDEFAAGRSSGMRGILGAIVGVLTAILAVGAFLYGIFFYDAVLSITPKHADVALQNQEFLAGDTSGGTEGATNGMLAFELMTITDEDSAELPATGEKNVNEKSSGEIVIYNDFSVQSQPLIKNTRFQIADGKIYRIQNSIVVPGQKIAGGKKTPGALTVKVYADAPGTEYNIGLSDFTIPGFKKSPKSEKIYARSKTPMTGGASGLVKVVSPDDIQKAKEALSAKLKEKLFAQALAQKPKGTVLYKDATFYSFDDSMDNTATAKSADDKSVKLTVSGKLTATLFNAEDLSKRIVKTSVPAIDVSENDRILVANIEELTFARKTPNDIAPKEGDSYAFTLDGNAKALWQVDTPALVGKLVGTKKADYQSVLVQFSGIEKASAHIRPFWKTKFPTDATKIRVELGQI